MLHNERSNMNIFKTFKIKSFNQLSKFAVNISYILCQHVRYAEHVLLSLKLLKQALEQNKIKLLS
jgi:hypothetical protein